MKFVRSASFSFTVFLAVSGGLSTLVSKAFAQNFREAFTEPAYVFSSPDYGISEDTGDEFGSAMVRQGDLLLISDTAAKVSVNGDAYVAAGRAYLYDLNTNKLLLTLDDASPEDDGHFGVSMALSNTHALVASRNSIELFDITDRHNGRAEHIFTLSSPEPEEHKWWGNHVGMAFWKNSFLLGNIGVLSKAPFIEVFDLNSFEKIARIDDPNNDPTSSFGSTLKVNDDYLLIGDPLAGNPENNFLAQAGAAYTYDLNTLSLLQDISSEQQEDGIYNLGEYVAWDGEFALLTTIAPFAGGNISQVHYVNTLTGERLHTFYAESASQYVIYGNGLAFNDDLVVIAYSNTLAIPTRSLSNFTDPRIYFYDRETKRLLFEFEDVSGYSGYEIGGSLIIYNDMILISYAAIGPGQWGEVRMYDLASQ